jgi:hypothetical protein
LPFAQRRAAGTARPWSFLSHHRHESGMVPSGSDTRLPA